MIIYIFFTADNTRIYHAGLKQGMWKCNLTKWDEDHRIGDTWTHFGKLL